MNKYLKIILLGILIWAIPFLVSFTVWDVEAGAPTVSMSWFNAIMAFAWAVGFAIALTIYFKGSKSPASDGWTAGILWYLALILLDLIVLVGLFKMAIPDWYPMLLTYLNTLVITVVVGKLLSKK